MRANAGNPHKPISTTQPAYTPRPFRSYIEARARMSRADRDCRLRRSGRGSELARQTGGESTSASSKAAAAGEAESGEVAGAKHGHLRGTTSIEDRRAST
jgi:hypothetical protein